jgi:leucyl-tRNA synthetase
MNKSWKAIEEKWQKKWSDSKIFQADPSDKSKMFVTFPYAYMNGPLHIGHAYTCLRVDIYARFKRMQGFNVLFPFAFHATGEPIAGVAERIRKREKSQMNILISGGVTPNEIEKFADPEYIVEYYRKDAIKAFNRIGFSIDWRRQFTTITEDYNRFIEWQYYTLRDKKYVQKGTHPVIWCPSCESPTGDHDRLIGEGVSPIEYILLKFKFKDSWLVMATLRPETIFGVVNVWINPNALYIKAQVNGENWIMSKDAAIKFIEQKKNLKIIEKFKGEALVGEYCTVPVTEYTVPIIPAEFVDPKNATGIVMSVPSHAPYDWLALMDLKNNPKQLVKYGLNSKLIDDIKPISLIETPGLGEHPAIEFVEKLNVKNQNDPKAEEATKLVYKKEFHQGKLKKNTGKYVGILVRDIKDKLTKDLINLGVADVLWETADKVVCRCNSQCIIKILENQWFLTYSDKKWKEIAHEVLNNSLVLPNEGKSAFEYTIDWLTDKACARKTGLGTRLPWDKDWIVETLSDSTIYMAFYTIAKFINNNELNSENLKKEFFDYVFLGKGDPNDVSNITKVNLNLLKKIKDEFEYWYPVDLRNSAKELVYNHFTFFLFHHGAIFPKRHWPKILGVNGMINIEGKKMSKSKGLFITINQAIDRFGASATRLELAHASEGLTDADWRTQEVIGLQGKISSIFNLFNNLPEMKGIENRIDKWLESRLNLAIKKTTEHYEKMEYRSALQEGFFNLYNDIRWYLRRKENPSIILKKAAETLVKLVAPILPHFSEELWESWGNKEFISTSIWPSYENNKIKLEYDIWENTLEKFMEDVREIMKVNRIEKLSTIKIFISPKWKYDVYNEAQKSTKNLIANIMKKEEIRNLGKDAVNYAKKLIHAGLVDTSIGYKDEFELFSNSTEFLKKELQAENIEIIEADKISHPKGKIAEPLKPGILIL